MRWLCGLLVGLLAGIACAGAPPRTLVLAAEAFPPHVFMLQGQPRGFDYEVCEQLLRAMGYRTRLEIMPWRRALLEARAGRVDGLLGVGRGALIERESFLDFPDEPLSGTRAALYFLRAKPFVYDGLFTLKGKSVAVLQGRSYAADFMAAPYFRREPALNPEQSLRMLLAGRVDLALVDVAVGVYLSEQQGLTERIARDGATLSSSRLYLAFSRQSGHDGALSRDFSRRLTAFKHSQVYLEILSRYGLSPEMVKAPEP
ncbi:transporter substrate-binding domain-containing protein [Paucibacter soli]|uniref:transporter substrate-binding domain-containing protein n=1 Tax=Paucibacter soli TaxID=3133433 RepID=UPI0030B3FC22